MTATVRGWNRASSWREARARFGAGGDFLFGRFCAADAMFAPTYDNALSGDYPLALTGGHARWSIHSSWRDQKYMQQLERGSCDDCILLVSSRRLTGKRRDERTHALPSRYRPLQDLPQSVRFHAGNGFLDQRVDCSRQRRFPDRLCDCLVHWFLTVSKTLIMNRSPPDRNSLHDVLSRHPRARPCPDATMEDRGVR